MAETYDVGVAPHCPLGPIALAACIQVDTAVPNCELPTVVLTKCAVYDIFLASLHPRNELGGA